MTISTTTYRVVPCAFGGGRRSFGGVCPGRCRQGSGGDFYAADETVIVNPYLIDPVFWERLGELGPECSRHLSICNPLEVNDHPTNLAAVRSNMYTPFCNGVSFYDYSFTGRFSHWKITYDHRARAVFHGSYNINERSACHDFELGLLVRRPAFADKVKSMIDYDLAVSRHLLE